MFWRRKKTRGVWAAPGDPPRGFLEARTTRGVLEAARVGASRVVLDPSAVAESPELSLPGLVAQLDRLGIEVISPDRFGEQEGRNGKAVVLSAPPSPLVLVSLSGGVGITTLAAGLAREAARRKVRVLLVHASHGKAPEESRTLADLWTGGLERTETPDQLEAWWDPDTDGALPVVDEFILGLGRQYALALFEGRWPHRLLERAVREAALVLVAADARAEAAANAVYLKGKLEGQGIRTRTLLYRAPLADRLLWKMDMAARSPQELYRQLLQEVRS
jgi:hypothetical protein